VITGFARIWRAPAVLWLTVLVNAVLQALLVLPNPQPGSSPAFIALTTASAVVAIVALAIVTTVALLTADGRVSVRGGLRATWERFPRLSLWEVVLLLALLVGTALWVVPGVIVAALTPYLLLAVADGATGRSALSANVAAIRRHPGRWLVMVAVMALVIAVSWLLAGVSAFFVGGAPSSFLTWLWFGVLAIWFQCSWAAVYRREGAPVTDPIAT